MPGMTFVEGIALVPGALELINQVETNVAAMPTKDQRKAVDYARAFGASEDGPLMNLAKLFDQVEADIKS